MGLGIISGTIQLINRASPVLTQVAQGLDTLGAGFRSLGMQVGLLGAALYKGLALPLQNIIKIGIDFEHQFANVVKTVGGFDVNKFGKLNKEAAAFKDELREMARTLPFTHKQLTEIAAFGGQFGVAKEDLGDFTSTVAKLGTTIDGIEVETAAKALAQIKNISGDASKGYGKLAATLVDLGNKGISTEGTILEITRRMSGAGAVAGFTASQMFGWSAAVANLGHRSELGGNAIANTILKISRAVSKGGKDLETFAKYSGKSAKQFAKDWGRDASGTLQDLMTKLSQMPKGKIPTAIADMFGTSVRQNQVILTLVNTVGNLNKTLLDSEQAYKAGTAMQEEFAKKSVTLQNQLQVLQNRLYDVAITIAQPFMDAIRDAIIWLEPLFKWVEDLSKAFDRLDKDTQRIIVVVTILAATALPALLIAAGGLLWVFGSLIGVIASVVGAFTGLAALVGGGAIATFLGTLVAGFTAFAMIAGVVIAAIGATILVLAILYKGFQQYKNLLMNAWGNQALIDVAAKLGLIADATVVVTDKQTKQEAQAKKLAEANRALKDRFADWLAIMGIVSHGQAEWIKETDRWMEKNWTLVASIDAIKNAFVGMIKEVSATELFQIITGIGPGGAPINRWEVLGGVALRSYVRQNYVPKDKPMGDWKPPKSWRFPQEGEEIPNLPRYGGMSTIIPRYSEGYRIPVGPTAQEEFDPFTRMLEQRELLNAAISPLGTVMKQMAWIPPTDDPFAPAALSAKELSAAAKKAREEMKLLEEAQEALEAKHNMIGFADFKKFTEMNEALKYFREQGITPTAAFMMELGTAAQGMIEYLGAVGIPLEAVHQSIKDFAKGSKEEIEKLNKTFLEMADKTKVGEKLQEIGKEIYDFNEKLKDMEFDEWVARQTNDTMIALGKWQNGLREVKEKLDVRPSNVSLEAWERYKDLINATELGKLSRIVQESKELQKVFALLSKLPGGKFGIKAIQDFLKLVGGGTGGATPVIPEPPVKGYELWKKSLEDVVKAFGKLKTIMGDAWDDDSLLAYIAELANLMNVAGEIGEQFHAAGEQFKAAFSGDGVDIGQAMAATVTGIMAAVQAYALLQAATDKASKGQRMLSGAMTGAAMGAAMGGKTGNPWLIAGGAIVGFIWGAFRKVPWAEIAKDVGEKFGTAISDSLAKVIAADAKKLFGGDRVAAEIYHLKEILDSAGGLDPTNYDLMIARLRDAFVMFEEGKFNAKELAKVLDETWDQFLEESTDAMGFVNAKFREIVDLSLRFNVNSKKTKEYFQQQGTALLDALNIMGGMMPKQDAWLALGEAIDESRKAIEDLNKVPAGERDSEWAKSMKEATDELNKSLSEQATEAAAAAEKMETLGITLAGTFFAAVAAGKSINEAMKEGKEGLDSYFKALKSLGLAPTDPLLKFLEIQYKINDAIPNTIAGVDALGSAIVAMYNMGMLTPDMFASMQKTGYDAYVAIQGKVAEVGGTTADALIPMQSYLHAAMKAAYDFGIPLDENTQMMIDQSKELGIWKELGPSAMEQMTSALNILIGKLDTLISKLSGLPDDVPDPFKNWEVPGVPNVPGGEPPTDPSGNPTPGYASGTMGVHGSWFKNFGTESFARLHGTEAVIRPDQAAAFAASVLGSGGSRGGGSFGGGGSTPVTLLIKNHKVFTEVVTEGQDDFLASRGVRR